MRGRDWRSGELFSYGGIECPFGNVVTDGFA